MTTWGRRRSRRALGGGSRDRLKHLIRSYFGGDVGNYAVFVATVVSGLDPNAYGILGPGRRGLFQIHPDQVGLAESQAWLLYNAVRNVAAAYKLHLQLGWSAWSCRALVERLFDDMEV